MVQHVLLQKKKELIYYIRYKIEKERNQLQEKKYNLKKKSQHITIRQRKLQVVCCSKIVQLHRIHTNMETSLSVPY